MHQTSACDRRRQALDNLRHDRMRSAATDTLKTNHEHRSVMIWSSVVVFGGDVEVRERERERERDLFAKSINDSIKRTQPKKWQAAREAHAYDNQLI